MRLDDWNDLSGRIRASRQQFTDDGQPRRRGVRYCRSYSKLTAGATAANDNVTVDAGRTNLGRRNSHDAHRGFTSAKQVLFTAGRQAELDGSRRVGVAIRG